MKGTVLDLAQQIETDLTSCQYPIINYLDLDALPTDQSVSCFASDFKLANKRLGARQIDWILRVMIYRVTIFSALNKGQFTVCHVLYLSTKYL